MSENDFLTVAANFDFARFLQTFENSLKFPKKLKKILFFFDSEVVV